MKVKDEDLKRELLKAINGEDLITNCAKRLGIGYRTFKVKLYRARIHGIDAVLHASRNESCSDSIKLEVIDSLKKGMPVSTAATKFNMSRSAIQRWMKKFEAGGEEAVLEDNRGKSKMGRKPKPKLSDYEPGSVEYLKLENEMLRRENLLLKKAMPLIQESERRTLKGKKNTETSGN